MSCFGCLCNFCARNVNNLQYFTPGEVDACCFNCDDCIDSGGRGRGSYPYTGRWKGECPDFLEAQKHVEMRAKREDARAKAARGNFVLIGRGENGE